jgi:hypothetical protein
VNNLNLALELYWQAVAQLTPLRASTSNGGYPRCTPFSSIISAVLSSEKEFGNGGLLKTSDLEPKLLKHMEMLCCE